MQPLTSDELNRWCAGQLGWHRGRPLQRKLCHVDAQPLRGGHAEALHDDERRREHQPRRIPHHAPTVRLHRMCVPLPHTCDDSRNSHDDELLLFRRLGRLWAAGQGRAQSQRWQPRRLCAPPILTTHSPPPALPPFATFGGSISCCDAMQPHETLTKCWQGTRSSTSMWHGEGRSLLPHVEQSGEGRSSLH